jgi:hypothetical protein
VITGILVGWALTFDHGGVIVPPDNSDSGDHIASLWQAG